MARYLEPGDTVTITDPEGFVTLAPWTCLFLVQAKSSPVDGRDIFRCADDGAARIWPTRGVVGGWRDGLDPRLWSSAGLYGSTTEAITIDSWHNIAFSRAGPGVAFLNVTVDGTKQGDNNDPHDEIEEGDVFRLGGPSDEDNAPADTYYAMVAWLQGVDLSGVAVDAYVDDPQSLYDDYGPDGAVSAGALKLLLLGDLSTDYSGQDNHPSLSGGSVVPSPDGYPVAIGDPPDETPPTLTSASASATGQTTGSGSVSTDEGNGTLYWVVTTSSTPPSAAQVQAGQDHTGAAAVDDGSQAVSGTGVQNVSGGFTGLTASTTYYAHYCHVDDAENESNVATSSSFTTSAVPPTVTDCSPSSGPTAGGTNVTIEGTGFASGATVSIGGNAATSVTRVNATTITCTTPAGTAGAKNVVVTNPDTQFDTLTNGFTYVAPPVVSSISPAEGSESGGTAYEITGTGFVSGATVEFGANEDTGASVDSSTKITGTTPAGSLGDVDVTVTNPDNQYDTLTDGFEYMADPEPPSGVVGPATLNRIFYSPIFHSRLVR